jgi:hypothetical protein
MCKELKHVDDCILLEAALNFLYILKDGKHVIVGRPSLSWVRDVIISRTSILSFCLIRY